jgi:muramoyltetrapeptide carboxypeptidase|nr:S66 peptidase family protein [uncultured Acetatifactor sp.]
MRYPKHLPQGGTIGFLAPSFGCNIEPYRTGFDHALEEWQKMGYHVLLGPNCYVGDGIGISSTPENCGREVMKMFLSGEADCLISCGGGELMCEILPYVDFERLAQAEPKWFMGYSDNTNLTYLLATLADTASVYGPCASSFGMEPWHEALWDAFGILAGKSGVWMRGTMGKTAAEAHMSAAGREAGRKGGEPTAAGGDCSQSEEPHDAVVRGYGQWEKESLKNPENPLAPYNLTEPLEIRTYVGREPACGEVAFQGRLLGGCLDCLVNLPGTRFDRTREFVERYREDGIIWFLEACELNVFAIRRGLWQLEESGWFEHVKGFLIGRPENGEPMMGLDAYSAVLEVAGRKDVPVVMDVDLGHLPPMMPIVVGSMADVAVKGNDIRIEMRYV